MYRIVLFVGLDYHDVWIQVCVMDAEGRVLLNRRCVNDWRAIVAMVEQVRPGAMIQVAIEACSGAANLADELIEHTHWSVDVAHPGYVARMKRNPDKHDFGDARMLADLERVGYVPRVWLAPEAVRELRRLVRYRQQRVDEARDARLRIRALLREHRVRSPYRAWSRGWLAWLREEVEVPEQSRWIIGQHLASIERLQQALREVEKRLAEATREDTLVERLLEQPGIGPVTAWTIRAEIGRFDRFRTGKQLARFCAVTPRNASSGCRQADAGLIEAGSRQLRGVLIEAAHRLARYHPRWSALAASLRARGKSGSLVAAAIANRWVRWLYHQMQAEPVAA